jgi:hypothetical protein
MPVSVLTRYLLGNVWSDVTTTDAAFQRADGGFRRARQRLARSCYEARMSKIVTCISSALLATACGGAAEPSPAAPAATSATAVTPATPMSTFEINGYLLAGAEYWPYVGERDLDYPKEVLWGFYPEKGVTAPGETDPNVDSARPEAIACAEQAYAALRDFVESDPPTLRRIVELGAAKGYVPRFYLWTNDYGRAATPFPPGVREARLWYWMRKEPAPPKPPGYWKWEATLTQAGECQIPRQPQIDAMLSETLAKVEAAPAPAR